MSLDELTNRISDRGSLRVDVSLMKTISILCEDILQRSPDIKFNWDVVSLYFTPEDGAYEQKERYDSADASNFLMAWPKMEGTTTSTAVARGLQGLEYILDMTKDDVDIDAAALAHDIRAAYISIGCPID